MEPAAMTAAPPALAATRLLAIPPPRGGFASISLPTSIGGGGDRGGGRSDGGGRGGGGGGGDSGASAAAAMALVEAGALDGSDVILLHVGGMSCGGCAAKVKRILESQPEVASATIDLAKAAAVVRTTPEAMATKDWHKELGEKLANHLRNCGFESHIRMKPNKVDLASALLKFLTVGWSC